MVVATAGTIICFVVMVRDIKGASIIGHYIWFLIACFWFTIMFALQALMVVLLLKAYVVIKNASQTLGMQSKDQTNQLCLMLFNTIMIAVSFLVWYLADNVAFYLEVKGDMDKAQGLLVEASVRLVRIFCQQIAFTWILISFQKYGTNVDSKIEKQKQR